MKKTIFTLLVVSGFMLAGSAGVKGDENTMPLMAAVPDWSKWTCDQVHISHVIIETHVCHGLGEKQVSRVILKLKGESRPFLIAWGLDKGAENPREKVFAAIFKSGGWIVGAPGTGFTTEESDNSITFYIFLDQNFTVHEQVEIKIPDPEAEKVIG